MASLSNINGLFDVHSTGAILFSTSHGTSGQILRSNGNAAPTWVAASTVIGGPYLPLTGGTLTGNLALTDATNNPSLVISTGSLTVGGATTLSSTLTISGRATFPSAVANRPQLPGGFLGLNTGDGNFDIWGISTQYYPSHATAANAWGLKWDGDSNQFRFVGNGQDVVTIDLDQGNFVTTGIITAPGGNSSQWNTAYDNSITALAVSGTTTKTLTATQQDGGTLTASWTDNYENYDYWTLQGDSAANVNINSTNILKFVGGTYVDANATWAGGSNPRKLTINHESTSRTDTTSTDEPAFGGTFEAVTSVTTNTTGHVTAIDVSTITIPTDPGGTVKGTGTATRVAFWSANDTISSSADLYWDNTNARLAIGMTSAPNAKLHVSTNGSRAHPNSTGIDVAAGAGGGNLLALDAADNHNWFPYTNGDNYYSANNHLFRSGTGNSPYYMTINTSGNVGIGMGSSFSSIKLQVQGSNHFVTFVNPSTTANHYAQMLLKAGDRNNYIWTANQNSTNWGGAGSLNIYTAESGSSIAFFTEGDGTNTKLMIQANGSIGINKTTGLNAGGFGSPKLVIKQSVNNEWGAINVEATNNDAVFAFGTTDDAHRIAGSYRATAGYKPIYISTAGSIRMALDTSGGVGIGTTTPEHALVVIGTIGFGLNYNGGVYVNNTVTSVDENWGLEVQRTANVDDYNTRLKYYPVSGQSRAAGIYDSRNARFSLYSDTNNNPNIIIPNGSVGIGVTSPGAKLEVEGGTNAIIKMNSTSGTGGRMDFAYGGSIYGNIGSARNILGTGNAADMMVNADSLLILGVGSQDMTILPSGNVGIGVTGPTRKLQIEGGASYPLSVNSTQRYLQEFKRSGVSEWWIAVDNGSFILHENGVGDKITVASGGTLTAAGDLVAYSDERLKSNIKTLDGSKVLKMRGVSFEKEGKQGSGVIAQELEKVAPELVNNDNEYKGVAYGNLVGYLIEAIKELEARVKELENK